jgi:hypothetical protein
VSYRKTRTVDMLLCRSNVDGTRRVSAWYPRVDTLPGSFFREAGAESVNSASAPFSAIDSPQAISVTHFFEKFLPRELNGRALLL